MQNLLFNKVSEIIEEKNPKIEIKKSGQPLLQEARTKKEYDLALKF